MANEKRPARSTRGQPVQTKTHSGITKRRLIPAVLLAVLGAVLLLYQPVMNNIVGPAQLDKVYASANELSAEDIQQNIERHKAQDDESESDELFDPESIETINSLSPNPVIDTKNVVGGVYAPSVDMRMPIMHGMSQSTLLSSAGTMKRDQQMGVGNYALIGHNSKNPDALFAPTHNLAPGDLVYVTDKQTVYTYNVTVNRVVEPSAIHVINDVAGETTLTLISCTDDGTQRVVVQAELVAKENYENANTDVIKAFNDL